MSSQTTLNQFFGGTTQPKKRTKKHQLSPPTKKERTQTDDPTCPICATVLRNQSEHQVQSHVNQCLDQSIPVASSSKPIIIPEDDIQLLHHSPAPRKPSIPPPTVQEKKKTTTNKQTRAEPEPKPPKNTRQEGITKKDAQVPFYKLLPGTSLTVDAFKYGKIPNVTSYFLSHAHSDHYTKLNSKWNHGPIYCSTITSKFVRLKLKVDPKWINPLQFNRKYSIDNVDVTLISANHCPGSAMFLFEGNITTKDTQKKPFRYLHCGDFRASPQQLNHPSLRDKPIDICFLDTTYLDPQYSFPAQDEVINGTSKLIESRLRQIRQDPHSKNPLRYNKNNNNQNNNLNLEKSKLFFKSWLSLTHQNGQETDDIVQVPDVDDPSSALFVDLVSDPLEQVEMNDLERKETQEKVIEEEKDKNKEEEKDIETRRETYEDGEEGRRTLIVVGTYSIGKERIVIKLAELLKTRVFCADPKKFALLNSIIDTDNMDDEDQDGKIKEFLSVDPLQSHVHIVNLFNLRQDFLKSYLNKFSPHFSNVIGIKPTGWTFKPKRGGGSGTSKEKETERPSINVNNKLNLIEFIQEFQRQPAQDIPIPVHVSSSNSNKVLDASSSITSLAFPKPVVEIYSIPYSEHSSFYELTCFCISLNWSQIIPTVNVGSASSRAKMKHWIDRWKQERNRLLKSDPPVFPQLQSSSLLIPARGLNYW